MNIIGASVHDFVAFLTILIRYKTYLNAETN